MAKTCKLIFKAVAKPLKVYRLYMDEKIHSEIIQSKVKIISEAGGKFTMGTAKGKFLYIQKNKMVVQLWRDVEWNKSIPDSVLTIAFNPIIANDEITGTIVEIFHSNIPEEFVDSIKSYWKDTYFKGWKQYLKR